MMRLMARFRRFRGIAIAVTLALVSAIWLRCGPLPPDLLKMDAIDSTVVVDRNGAELYEALGGDGTRARQLRADDVPAIVAAATVAAEDRRFWSHHGVDPIAVLRAIKQNVAEGSIVEGGSTIAGEFLDAGLVNKITFFIAPKIIGGTDAPSAVGGQGVDAMAEALELERVTVTQRGKDIEVTGYPRKGSPADEG